MGLKRFLAALGAGGAEVETVLQNPNVYPGGQIQGVVHLSGGDVDQYINSISVNLTARVEVESGDSEYATNIAFTSVQLSGRFHLHPRQRYSLPFSLGVPWEAPMTTIQGYPLRTMMVGVGTRLDIANAADSHDLDPLAIHALPPQQRILDALNRLGFRFRTADLEKGYIRGTRQQLPFYQEIEFAPAPQYAHGMNQLEVSFIATPTSMDVVLEVDKKGGLFTEGRDTYQQFVVESASYGHVDWEGHLHQMLQQMSQRRGFF